MKNEDFNLYMLKEDLKDLASDKQWLMEQMTKLEEDFRLVDDKDMSAWYIYQTTKARYEGELYQIKTNLRRLERRLMKWKKES